MNSKKLHVEAESLDYDPVKRLLIVRGTKDQPVRQLDDNGLPVAWFDELTYNTETGQMTSKNPTFKARQTGATPTPTRTLPGAR